MAEIKTFLTVLLAICGGTSIVFGAINIVSKAFNPYRDLEKKVKMQEQIIKRDNERLQEVEEANKLTLKCMLALIEHETTGNGIKDMKSLKSDIQDFLLDK